MLDAEVLHDMLDFLKKNGIVQLRLCKNVHQACNLKLSELIIWKFFQAIKEVHGAQQLNLGVLNHFNDDIGAVDLPEGLLGSNQAFCDSNEDVLSDFNHSFIINHFIVLWSSLIGSRPVFIIHFLIFIIGLVESHDFFSRRMFRGNFVFLI